MRDGVDICYSSANKCLHSVSGVSFLCVAPEVWPRIAGHRAARLLPGPAAPPPLPGRAAPDAVHARGVVVLRARDRARRARTSRAACPRGASSTASATLRIRRVFTDLGFESFTNTGRESHTISMLRLPDGLTVDALYDGLKARGFIIYRAKGELADRLHPGREHGRAPRRDHRRLPGGRHRRRPRRARGRRAGGAPRAQVGLSPMRAALFRRTAGPRSWRSATCPTPDARAGRGAGARHGGGAEPHRSVAAAGAARAAGRACRTSRAATSAASSRRSARASSRCRRWPRAIACVVNPSLSCGRCAACLAGRDNFCPDCRMLGEQTLGRRRPSTSSCRPQPRAGAARARRRSTTPQLAAMPIVVHDRLADAGRPRARSGRARRCW